MEASAAVFTKDLISQHNLLTDHEDKTIIEIGRLGVK